MLFVFLGQPLEIFDLLLILSATHVMGKGVYAYPCDECSNNEVSFPALCPHCQRDIATIAIVIVIIVLPGRYMVGQWQMDPESTEYC